jgi:hypothetical protein
MNTNFYLIEVIQKEKMEEIREVSDKGSLIKLLSKKGTETKIYHSMFVEMLLQFRAWLSFEIKSLNLSSR